MQGLHREWTWPAVKASLQEETRSLTLWCVTSRSWACWGWTGWPARRPSSCWCPPPCFPPPPPPPPPYLLPMLEICQVIDRKRKEDIGANRIQSNQEILDAGFYHMVTNYWINHVHKIKTEPKLNHCYFSPSRNWFQNQGSSTFKKEFHLCTIRVQCDISITKGLMHQTLLQCNAKMYFLMNLFLPSK